MKAKITMGLALVGGLSAPTAANVTTQTFNLPNDGSFIKPVNIGGNNFAQYNYSSNGSYDFKTDTLFNVSSFESTGPTSSVSSLATVVGPVGLPDPNGAYPNSIAFPGNSNATLGARYLPLKFQINGADHVGNAFFTTTSGLDRVEYAAVATAAVPEPATWVELLAGFAMAGAAVRSRRQRRQPAVLAA